MTSDGKPKSELDSVRRESRIISGCVWGVAVGVMIYGIGNVYGLLVGHDVPAGIAWLLSPMVDAGLCVGLVGTRGLTRYDVAAGWIGALRWITALMTWGLNTATPITRHDLLGVFIHSVGPVLLFVVVEAAAYFQNKMGRIIADKQAALDTAAAQRDAADRHHADLSAQLDAAHAEITARQSTIDNLTTRLDTIAADGESQKLTATLTVERLEAEIGELRTALTAQAVQRAEDLRRAKAEAGTVNLTAYRNRGNDSNAPQPSNRPAMSDEAAVQAMLDAHRDPDFAWSKNAVRTLTGAGFGRIPGLIDLWLTAASGKARDKASGEADGDQAVNQ